MKIQHNKYGKGEVQSLAFVDENGVAQMSIGMMMQGDYDFKTAKTQETIEVITGVLIINGERVERGEWSETIQPGEQILISAVEDNTTYRCNYGDPSSPDDRFLLVKAQEKDGPDPLGR